MSISDIITLVSLVIAIVAIISEKSRQHLLLKLYGFDYVLFILAFILINYFVFYESFYNMRAYLPQLYFETYGFDTPENWAYVIAICCLIYLFYKVLFSYYPYNRIEKVHDFYRKQIENGEISFLLDLLEKYHKADIIRGIKKADNHEPLEKWWEHEYRKEEFTDKLHNCYSNLTKSLFPSSWQNRHDYAYSVLHNIINDPAFITLASNQRPYFFSDIIAYFSKQKRRKFPNELINSFLLELVQHKNFWLKKELKQSQNNDYGQPEWFFDKNRILSSLLQDLSVADVNNIWQPFGNSAIEEIEEERTKGYESKLFQEFREEQFLWEYKTYYTIQFFKVLITEAIIKKYTGTHFFLYYYRSITDAILKTFERYPPANYEVVVSIHHKFIGIMIDNLFLWLEISNKKGDKSFYHDVLKCLGNIIDSVCKSFHYGEKRKIDLIENLLSYYCDLRLKEDNKDLDEEKAQLEMDKYDAEINKVRGKVEDILNRPSMLTNENSSYYRYLALAWKDFDRISHRTKAGFGKDYDYFHRLKEKVIIPRGLDPT